MTRDNYGRPRRLSAEEIKNAADRAAQRARPAPVPVSAKPKNKGGRPATGVDPLFSVRIPKEWLEIINTLPHGKRMAFVREMMRPGMEKALNDRRLAQKLFNADTL